MRALCFAAGLTSARVTLWGQPPGLHLMGPRPLHFRGREAPPGAPAELWREPFPPQPPAAGPQPLAAGPQMGGGTLSAGSVVRMIGPTQSTHRAMRLEPWSALALPGGEPLWPQGGAWGGNRPYALTFDAPPLAAQAVRLRFEGGYRWENVAAFVEVPPPGSEALVDLGGLSLACGDRLLDLLAWEPDAGFFRLVARPADGFDPPGWPEWVPDPRLVLGEASCGLAWPLAPTAVSSARCSASICRSRRAGPCAWALGPWASASRRWRSTCRCSRRGGGKRSAQQAGKECLPARPGRETHRLARRRPLAPYWCGQIMAATRQRSLRSSSTCKSWMGLCSQWVWAVAVALSPRLAAAS